MQKLGPFGEFLAFYLMCAFLMAIVTQDIPGSWKRVLLWAVGSTLFGILIILANKMGV